MSVDTRMILRKAELIGVLERMCQSLELTDTQERLAQERYEAIGAYLAASKDPLLRGLMIYVQGSTALRTTVKPMPECRITVNVYADRVSA